MAADKSVMLGYMHGSVPRKPSVRFEKADDDMDIETDDDSQGPLSLPPSRPEPQGPPYSLGAPNPGPRGPFNTPRESHPDCPGFQPVPGGPSNPGSLVAPRGQTPGYLGHLSGFRGPTPGFQGPPFFPGAPTPGYQGSPASLSSSLRPGPPSGLPRSGTDERGGLSVPRQPVTGCLGEPSTLRGLALDYKEPRPLPRAPTGYQDLASLSKGYTEPSSLPRAYTEPNYLTKGYTDLSSLSKGYPEPSFLSKGYTDPSSLTKGYTDPSSLSKAYTEPSSLSKGYTDPNSLSKGYTDPNSLSKGYTEPSSFSKAYTEPSSLTKGYSDPNSFTKGYSEPNSFTKGYSEPNSFTKGYTEPNSLTRVHTELGSLTKGYTEPSSRPRGSTGYQDPSSLPKGYTVPNTLPREYQDPLSLPRAYTGHQGPNSLPRSFQESFSHPTGRQESSLPSSHTASYQGSSPVPQGSRSASQWPSYKDSTGQGQSLFHRGSAQQAPYSKPATSDGPVSGGANLGYPSTQRGPLITEQEHSFSRLAPSQGHPSVQQPPLLTHPEHPVSTHHPPSSTTYHDQQSSAKQGYSASLGSTTNRDSPSVHYRPPGSLPASQTRSHGSQDADLTASHSGPQQSSSCFPTLFPAYQKAQSSPSTSKPTAVDQGPASACSAVDTSPSTYRGLPPASSLLRAARSEDLMLPSAHEGSNSFRTEGLRSSDLYAGPIQIHRNVADLAQREEKPVWSFRRHFRSQSPPSRTAAPQSRSGRSRSRSPHSSQTRDRSPQRLVRRSRSPCSAGERNRSPQRPPRRSRSPPNQSPHRLSKRSRSPLLPPRYRPTRPASTRNGSRSLHFSVPPPRRSRVTRSRSLRSRRPRKRSPKRGPRRIPVPYSPRRTRSPQKEGDRNRSPSPRSLRNLSPPRGERHSRSPLPRGNPARNRSADRGARPVGQPSSMSINRSPLPRFRKGNSRSRNRSPRSRVGNAKSRSPVSKNLSPPQQGEDSQAVSHPGRGISPVYRLASRLEGSRKPLKSRHPETEARRSGERLPEAPFSRNWPSQNQRNPQNSMLPSSSAPSKKFPPQPRSASGSSVPPPKMWPLNKGQSSQNQAPSLADPGQRQPLRPLMPPKRLLPSRRIGASPPKTPSLPKKRSPEMEAEHQPELLPSEAQPSPEEVQDYSESAEDPDGPPRQHYGVRIEPFPTRSSNKDISYATFRVFKKFGYVSSIEIHGAEEGRFCLVFYRDEVGREKALVSGQGVDLLMQAMSVSAYDGPETESNVVFRPSSTKATTKPLMQFSKNATKTLFIKNLDSSLARGDLHLTFQAYGRILEINVKKKFNESSSLAFIQYSDTLSVTRAIKAMNGAPLGDNILILTYAQTEPTKCVWIDGLKGVSQVYLNKLFSRYGPVALTAIDEVQSKALIFFYEVEHAHSAVNAMKGQRLAGCFVAVDFANYECQTDFYCTMHSTEQDVVELYEFLMADQ